MAISTEILVRVAHADVMMQMALLRSVRHWHRGGEHEEQRWRTYPPDCAPLLIGENDGVVIDGNCSNGVSAPDGGVIHVCGDLASNLYLGGHHEVVVAGDVRAGAVIEASGFCHVFVGRNFHGELRSSGSTKFWIEGDSDGLIMTGSPANHIYIGRDYNGRIAPTRRPALLWLTVGGFAAQVLLSDVAKCGYTQFHGSVALSDVAPGVYPEQRHQRKTTGGNSYNRWCVLGMRD